MSTKNFSKSSLQQVCRRVIALNECPSVCIHRRDYLSFQVKSFGNLIGKVNIQGVLLLGICDTNLKTVFSCQEASIANLATTLCIKRSSVEYNLELNLAFSSNFPVF